MAAEIREQIAQAERHHRESGRAAFRPVMIVRDADIFAGRYTDGDLVLTLSARNVGPGPALNVSLFAWLFEADPDLTVERIDELVHSVDLDEPEFLTRAESFAAGEVRRIEMNPARRPSWRGFQNARTVLLYFVRYTNVWGDQLPEKDRAEWKAGSYVFPIDWAPTEVSVVNSGGQPPEP